MSSTSPKRSSKPGGSPQSTASCSQARLSYCCLKQLRNEYGDRVAFVYRHFPLDIHPNAFDESRAIACAGTIGGAKALYEYIDTLYGYKFSKQDPVSYSFPPLAQDGKEAIAKSIGLDSASFSLCMNGEETGKEVSASLKDGENAGVRGTPSTFVLIKNRKGYEVVADINGAQSPEYFKAAIDEALIR